MSTKSCKWWIEAKKYRIFQKRNIIDIRVRTPLNLERLNMFSKQSSSRNPYASIRKTFRLIVDEVSSFYRIRNDTGTASTCHTCILLGGCTYTEISAIRFLAQDYELVVALGEGAEEATAEEVLARNACRSQQHQQREKHGYEALLEQNRTWQKRLSHHQNLQNN
ncbi:15021_t:CDS:2 [Cetraspora pellucida]|uniref:15021_t:CDS:1 n=1 Tax=Cetraspora pellucida TaxID=1433469 RepID=A0ACA9L858_9GLOM|nr:15021_t:CDS:2 [Cetraspora pellucida]